MKNKPLIINRSGTSRRSVYKNESEDPIKTNYTVTHEEWDDKKKEFRETFRKNLDYWYEACNFVNYKLCLVE